MRATSAAWLLAACVGTCTGEVWREVGTSGGKKPTLAESGLFDPNRPSPRGGAAGAYCQGLDATVISGGASGNRLIMDMWTLVLGKVDTWERVNFQSGLPGPRYGHSLTVFRDGKDYCELLMLGGFLEGNSIGIIAEKEVADMVHVIRLVRNENGGLVAASRPLKVENLAAQDQRYFHIAHARLGPSNDDKTLLVSDEILVFGAVGESDLAGEDVFSVRLNYLAGDSSPEMNAYNATWQAVQVAGSARPPPLTLAAAAPIANGRKLAIFGGLALSPQTRVYETVKQVWILDLDTLRWNAVLSDSGAAGSDHFRRHGHAMAAWNDNLISFSGVRYFYQGPVQQGSPYYAVYFQRTIVSDILSSSPGKRCNAANGELWCVRADEEAMKKAELFPACRRFHTSVTRKDSLLVMFGHSDASCGRNRAKVLDDAWELNMTEYLGVPGGPSPSFVSPRENFESQPPPLVSTVYFFFGILSVTCIAFVAHFMRMRYVVEQQQQDISLRAAALSRAEIQAGLKQEEIDALPEITFRECVNDENDGYRETCSICLSEYEEKEKVMALPCNHLFHRECGQAWLLKKNCCPLCKQEVCRRPRGQVEEKDEDQDEEENSDQLAIQDDQTRASDASVAVEMTELPASSFTNGSDGAGRTETSGPPGTEQRGGVIQDIPLDDESATSAAPGSSSFRDLESGTK